MKYKIIWLLIFWLFLLPEPAWGKAAEEISAGLEARRQVVLEVLTNATGMRNSARGLARIYKEGGFSQQGDYLLGQAAGEDPKCEEYCNCNPSTCGQGGGYWSLPILIRAYFMYRPGSTYGGGRYAGRITQATADKIRGFYGTYLRKGAGKGYGSCGGSCAGESTINAYRTTSPYTYISQTDNHTLIQASSILLGSQINKENNPEMQTIYQNWRTWWLRFLDGLAKRGFYELGSPTYVERHLAPLYNLYDFAEDELIRKKAEIVLDQYWAEIALDMNNGIRGGAKTRVYGYAPGEGDRGAGSARNDCLYPIYYLYFGEGNFAIDRVLPNAIQYGSVFATSGYVPPAVILELAVNEEMRGNLEVKERRKGSCFVFNEPNLEGKSYNSRRYAWVTPDYILGSFQSDADKQFMAQSSQDATLQYALVFPTHPEAKIAFGSSGAQTNGRIESFGYKNTIIVSSVATYADNDERPNIIAISLPNRAFSENITDSGWTFIREGKGYAAIKAVQDSLLIIEAGREADDGSFADFKSRVKQTRMERSADSGYLTYFNSKGDELYFPLKRSSEINACHYSCNCSPSDTRLPKVNGQIVDWKNYPYFGSPYVNSDWDSGLTTVNFNGRSLTLDMRDPQNPIKTEGTDNCPARERGNLDCDPQGLVNQDDLDKLIREWGFLGDEEELTIILKNWTTGN